MFCPECGTEVADSAKSCTKCGRSLVKVKKRSGGGTFLAKLLLVLLIIIVLGTGAYAAYNTLLKDPEVEAFNPGDKTWVPMDFEAFGIKMDVPGQGWALDFNAESQVIFRDTTRGILDVRVLGAITLNPDSYRIDNKPEIFTITKQESLRLGGWGEEVLYTVAQGSEDGYLVSKHQIYFKRTFSALNKLPQTYTYLITMTCGSGVEAQYLPTFQHIIENIELYEYE